MYRWPNLPIFLYLNVVLDWLVRYPLLPIPTVLSTPRIGYNGHPLLAIFSWLTLSKYFF